MSEAGAGTTKQPDPMEKFRELRDAYLDIWSKNLIETVNTEGYAQASGAALDGYLNASAVFKEPVDNAMLRTLQQLNMPTSADFAVLSGRITNIEVQLDNLDAKLDRIGTLLTGLQSAKAAKSAAPTESAAQSEQAAAPMAAKKRPEEKPATVRARETSKRTTTGKPVRRNSRKGTE